jgi:hypothetical protein
MRQLKTVAIMTAITSVFLVSCTEKKITGEGPMTQEVRTVSDFRAMKIAGDFTVRVNFGDKPFLKVIAQKNIMPYLLTDVKSGELIIENDSSVRLSYQNSPEFDITVTELKNVDLAGSIKLLLSNYRGESLTIKTSGTHALGISGTSDSLTLESSGDISFNAAKFPVKSATIRVHGSGAANLYVSEELDVQVEGDAKINYQGNPKNVQQKVSGSGTIKPAN